MSEKIESLLEKFFELIGSKKWRDCQDLIERIKMASPPTSLSNREVSLLSKFMEAVLTYKQSGDLGLASRQMDEILDQNPPPALKWQIFKEQAIINGGLGNLRKTIELCESALEIIPKGNAVPKIKLRHNMAIALSMGFDIGDFGPKELKQAIDIIQVGLNTLEALPKSQPNQQLREEMLNTKGIILKSLVHLDDAEKAIIEKIEIYGESNDKVSAMYGWNSLGEILQAKGPSFWSKAESAYKTALDLHAQTDDKWDEVKVDILANLGDLSRSRGAYEEALDYYQKAIFGIEQLRAKITGGTARSGFFSVVVSVYDHAILLCVMLGQDERAFNFIEQARARSFIEMVSQKILEIPSQVTRPPITLKKVQSHLNKDDLILAYFTTGQAIDVPAKNDEQSFRRHRFPKSTSLIFAVSANTISIIDTNISPNDLQLKSNDPNFILNPSISRSMYNALIKPVEDHLLDKNRIYFMPHGPIHVIPLHALLAADSEPILRADGPLILYSPSASILFQSEHQAAVDLPFSRTCLTIGYVGKGPNKLEQAEKSAQHIADLWKGDSVVGSFSKIENLIENAHNYRYIHFACHGKFNMSSPLLSELLVADGERLTAEIVISRLKLNCDLVILSACETGMNQTHRGDEHDGFVRAFMIAGAKAVLTANWKVHDHSTAILMEHFHTLLKLDIDPAEALKKAQIYLKNLTVRETEAAYQRLDIKNFSNKGLQQDAIYFDESKDWAAFNLKVRY